MPTRREILAALASAAALPLVTGFGGERAPWFAMANDADALKLLDSVADNLLRLQPEAATSLGIDTGARAALRSQLARSIRCRAAAAGQADQRGPDRGSRHSIPPASRTSSAPASRSCAAPMPRRSKGFALPYGDIAVGGWRNTPYVVIQNVGAYLDIPRFLDSDHPIDNAADAEAYLARLQSYAEAARRRARTHEGRARPPGSCRRRS